MKRILSIVTALLVAALFILPAASIAYIDGTEPEWTGDPNIRPMMENIDGLLDETAAPDLQPGETIGIVPLEDGIQIIGEPTDELFEEGLDTEDGTFDRSPYARGAEAEAELAGTASVSYAVYIALGVASFTALLLSAVALVKVSRKK